MDRQGVEQTCGKEIPGTIVIRDAELPDKETVQKSYNAP